MRLCLAFLLSLSLMAAPASDLLAPGGWQAGAPRDEIRPRFAFRPSAGRGGSYSLSIEADGREGLDGYWHREFPVQGGKHCVFSAYRKAERLPNARQNALVTIQWLDAEGNRVLDDRSLVQGYLKNYTPYAAREFPRDGPVTDEGWTPVTAQYLAPTAARTARVELHLMWAPRGRVEWSQITLTGSSAPTSRKVRLAAVHYKPVGGKSPQENRDLFAPLLAKAAGQKADLVVLGETLTWYGNPGSPAEVAEPIPGPSTKYFGMLAKQHDLYIVAGLVERDRHLVYNTSVLLAPDGTIAGKYRKVTLPENEVHKGFAPGREYPVFATRFGKVGMMICYDGFFPEVARELAKNGAEVIAWPVWGCNPELARARAIENQVYLVSSTYEDVSSNWMLSAVWDHAGRTPAAAKAWGSVVVAEVDLNEQTIWRSLGNFRERLPRHAPAVAPSPSFR